MRTLLVVLGLVSLASTATAQEPKCASEQHRRFASLEGEWDSIWVAKSQLVGRYRFETTSGGCAIVQSWTGAPATPGTGTGLIAYSSADRSWHRFWTDDTGTWEMMTAPAGNGPTVTWSGRRTDPKDPTNAIRIRIMLEANGDGTFGETYQISRDDGGSWTPFGQFLLRRPGSAGP